MQMLDHPNIVALKHSFFAKTEKEELYLNLVLEYVPETVNRIARQYSRMNQRMPLIYVKLYTYQVCRNYSTVGQHVSQILLFLLGDSDLSFDFCLAPLRLEVFLSLILLA